MNSSTKFSPTTCLLTESTLPLLSHTVQVPKYNRRNLRGGIVHIGAGSFNRSHMAVYLDDLLSNGGSSDWAEVGVGLMPSDKRIHDALAGQDFLYTLLERDTDQRVCRVVGSLCGHLFAPSAQAAVIAMLASPECAIISLTVTEAGYFQKDGSHSFRDEDAGVRHDLEHPDSPVTWLGYVCAAAERRSRSHGRPFTLLSCDNLQGNGTTARASLLAFAERRDEDLRRWLEANISTPNSMVDRITPRTTAADHQEILKGFGIDDGAPVVCEPFRQWVLEDTFIAGRPDWHTVGAEMTSDVAPYEKTKMRLLNGCHFTLAYPSAVLGLQYVADAMGDTAVAGLAREYQAEVALSLRDLPGLRISDYAETVLRRFANGTLRDQVARICSDGSAKITKFILPSQLDLDLLGISPHVLPFVLASWVRYLDGRTDSGDPYPIEDPSGIQSRAPLNAATALALVDGLSEPIARSPKIASEVAEWLYRMRSQGMRRSLKVFLAQLRSGGDR